MCYQLIQDFNITTISSTASRSQEAPTQGWGCGGVEQSPPSDREPHKRKRWHLLQSSIFGACACLYINLVFLLYYYLICIDNYHLSDIVIRLKLKK